MTAEPYGDDVATAEAVRTGVWSPFRSLLTAQALAAVLGLVFWVLAARLVEPHDLGIAAAAISAQTLLGIVTVLGHSTMLISELPGQEPARQRTLVTRSLLVVFVASALAAGLLVACVPLLPTNLNEALGNPIGAATFVLGTAGFAWALVVDDACLGVRRPGLQVGRNLVASSLRFPITAVLLLLGFTDAHVLQVCWVLPLLLSIPFTLWRLRLPRHDRSSPPLLLDVRGFIGLALRNHALSLALAAASQMIPVVAALTLGSVDNAKFAIAWLMATFVFLPPYLLSTALFAHGATVSEEEFRRSMERTLPAALALSLLLCVGAWVLGEPVLLIFGGDYSSQSWTILALLVPAGLWMVVKDHLVALWRTQRKFALATRLAVAALLIELVGALTGGIIGGARGLCAGWLIAMGVEMALGVPWLRQAFGGLHWRSPLPVRRRTEAGRAITHVIVGVVFVAAAGAVGYWSSQQAGESRGGDSTSNGLLEPGAPVPTCEPTAAQPGPLIDLNVQSATGDRVRPIRSYDEVRQLVELAKAAGARVISTTSSFRTMQPSEDQPIQFEYIDRTIGAARSAGLQVRLQLVGMPDWALDEPQFENQPPRSAAELEAWAGFVTKVMKHVDGKVDYLEVWNEPNGDKWWPTGPDPLEFARLLDVSYSAAHTVAPETKVVSGGLASNDIGYLSWVYKSFDELGLRASPFDMVGAHPFSGDHAPDSVDPGKRYERSPFGLYDENFTGFMGLHDVMVTNGDDLPVYITQFGYSTRAGEDWRAVPDEVRAQYLTQAFKQATCSPYVPIFSWYALHPTPWDPQEYTLLDRQNRPNQTYEALVTWAQRAEGGAGE